MMATLLSVRDIRVEYRTERGSIAAVKGISFDVQNGDILGVVGESGSGKSTLAYSILNFIKPPGRVTSGQAILEGVGDLLKMQGEDLRKVLWKEVAIVPQATQNSMNPTMDVKGHFVDTMAAHGVSDKSKVLEVARRLLEEVKLDPDWVLNAFPHQLSGGMKQRVLIALSLVFEPKLLILDEPTSALDVVNQRLIMDLLKALHEKMNVTIIFITHDIQLIKGFANRVLIMYAGKAMELGDVDEVWKRPINPYTIALLRSIPSLHGDVNSVTGIPGSMPDPYAKMAGCPFAPRCKYAQDVCFERDPDFVQYTKGHYSACHFSLEIGESYGRNRGACVPAAFEPRPRQRGVRNQGIGQTPGSRQRRVVLHGRGGVGGIGGGERFWQEHPGESRGGAPKAN